MPGGDTQDDTKSDLEEDYESQRRTLWVGSIPENQVGKGLVVVLPCLCKTVYGCPVVKVLSSQSRIMRDRLRVRVQLIGHL